MRSGRKNISGYFFDVNRLSKMTGGVGGYDTPSGVVGLASRSRGLPPRLTGGSLPDGLCLSVSAGIIPGRMAYATGEDEVGMAIGSPVLAQRRDYHSQRKV